MYPTLTLSTRHGHGWWCRFWLVLALGASLGAGCSIKKMAVNRLSDALAGGGTTFASDDDPELVKAAVPFSLKLIESLLAESPRHGGLLLAAASGFTQYSYAFVSQEADEKEDSDLTAAEKLRARAKRLYLRARSYGLRGLALRHPDFERDLHKDAKAALSGTTRADVPFLYWTAASWGAVIGLSKDDPTFVSDQLLVEALIQRALVLDESFGQGAVHGFMIAYEMSRPGNKSDAAARARRHFERAMELGQGKLASPLVSLAEAVCVLQQQRTEFETSLQRALAIDADAVPAWRLQNLVAQRRARWLLARADDLFLGGKKEEAR